jgi:endogenous inhibitor of DNA gyrase (YacG/DUF329 family)
MWRTRINMGVDYTIVSKPAYVNFECPHCHEEAEVIFTSVDFNTSYWGDGGRVECPHCYKEVELGDYEYD